MNREDPVLRQIAELEQLEDQLANRHLLDVNTKNQQECPVCWGEWHGLPTAYCPGAWATTDQLSQHREDRWRRPTYLWVGGRRVGQMTRQLQAISYSQAPAERSSTLSHTHTIASQDSIVVFTHPLKGVMWSGIVDRASLEEMRNSGAHLDVAPGEWLPLQAMALAPPE